MLVATHRALGTTMFWLGAGASAHRHFAQGVALYDAQQHHSSAFLYGDDAGVVCHSRAAWTLWILGYPDQGLAHINDALTLAQQIAHPYSLGYALGCAAVFHQCRREGRATQERAEALISLATDQGFPLWVGLGTVLRGWALAMQGQGETGWAQMHQGLAIVLATGQEVSRSSCLVMLAEAAGHAGQVEEGLRLLAEALALLELCPAGIDPSRWQHAIDELAGLLDGSWRS